MNKNVVLAVAKRDLRSWFGNPASYVFIMLFVGIACVAMMWTGAFFTNNLANLDTLNAWFPIISALFIAAATMGMWTSERANGTQELLFTLPATDLELQLGKYVAYVAIYSVSLAFTLVLPIALTFLGNPDWGQLIANYIGYWLFGITLVAICTIGSQISNSATISLIVSVLLCAAFLFAPPYLGVSRWNVNGPIGQFRLFAGGELPFSGILLFLGMTVAFFWLGLCLLARRHWRSGVDGVHGIVQSGAFAVCAFALTLIGVHALPRPDATIEGIHSLGEESRKLIAGLDSERPVYVTAYVSEEVPEQFVQQKSLLLNLISQFDRLGGNAVETSIKMPEPYSPEAREAEANFGIRAMGVQMELPGGGIAEKQIFLGFVVQAGTEEVVTPFVEPAVPLEYELMRSIRTVANANRKKIGILKTDVEFIGGMDFQTFRQKQRWIIADELQQQYALENVDAEKDYPEGLACLVVPQPSSLQQEQMDRLRDWMLAGNPTLLLEDPMPMGAPGTAADDQKGGMQARMMGGGGPQKGNFTAFLAAIALAPATAEVAYDHSYRRFPFGAENPWLQWCLFLRGTSMAKDSAITNGLQSVLFLLGGHVKSVAKDGFSTKTLLSLPDPTVSREACGIVKKETLFQPDFFGTGAQLSPSPRRIPSRSELVLATRVTSKPVDAQQKAVDVIYVADLDVVSNTFFQMRRGMVDANLRFDNVTFVLNCIDSLAGDESLIELRKRRPILRKLETVEKAQLTFEEKWTADKEAAEVAAQSALGEAQGRLDEAVKKIREDGSMDEQAKEVKIVEVQQVENRKFENEKAKIEEAKRRKLEEATHDRDAAKRGINSTYRLTTMVFCLAPALLLAVAMFVRRNSRAAAIVPQNRKVSAHAGHGGVQ